MRSIGRAIGVVLLLLASVASARAACGDRASDPADVAALEAAVAAQCSCCAFPHRAAYLRCAVDVVSAAIKDQSL